MTVDKALQEEFFRAAAFLRREFLGSIRLRENADCDVEKVTQRRERTIFVFDTDLIVTACEPWLDTAKRYGSVFPNFPDFSDSPDSQLFDWQKRTGSIIANYALERVRAQSLPIYQLGPHFKETQNIYEKNARYFSGLVKARMPLTQEVDRERLRRSAALFRRDIEIDGHGTHLLPSLATMLQTLTPLNLPITKSEKRLQAWERFVKLNSLTGGIYPAARASNHLRKQGELGIAKLLEVLDENDIALKSDEKELFSIIANKMEKRINHFLAKETTGMAAGRRDAEAIARLYITNSRLAHAFKNGSVDQWRAVFVTGSRAVTEACYADPDLTTELFSELTTIPGINKDIAEGFSQKYVRHLWAYTTEALLEPGNETKFLGWLDGLLGSEADPTRFSERRLTQIVRSRRSNKDIELPTEITRKDIDEWERAVKAAVTRSRFAQLGIDHASAKKLQDRIVVRFKSNSFKSLDQEVQEQFQRAKDRAFVELSETGALSVVQSTEFGNRNPPDLAFGSLKNTNLIFKRLTNVDTYPVSMFREDLVAVEMDCYEPNLEDPEDDGDDRQRNHLKFLVIGSAFAAANKWGVALSQGEHAVAIIERAGNNEVPQIKVLKDETGRPITHMSGREAYFLCASAQRISAAQNWEFETARDFLRKAEAALKIDQKNGAAKRTTNVRFWSESLAIALSQYYLARWRASEESDLSSELYFCDSLAEVVFSELTYLLANIKDEARLGADFNTPLANFRGLGRITIINISVNIIQCCIIRIFRAINGRTERKSFSVGLDDLKQALSLLSDMLEPPISADWKPVRSTTLIDAYRSIGSLIAGEQLSSQVCSLVADQEGLQTAIYDPWRFENLDSLYLQLKEMNSIELHTFCFTEPPSAKAGGFSKGD